MQSSDLKNLKIAVVGVGYGGAAAAKALSLLGAEVDVYEQANRIREVGAGIGLHPATMNRFRGWGIFDLIAEVTSPSEYFEILTATGDPIMKETWPADGEQTRTHLIHRGDFEVDGDWYEERNLITLAPDIAIPRQAPDRPGPRLDTGRHHRVLQPPQGPQDVGHGPLPAHAVAPFIEEHDKMFRWYDHWIKGIDNRVMDAPPWPMRAQRAASAGRLPRAGGPPGHPQDLPRRGPPLAARAALHQGRGPWGIARPRRPDGEAGGRVSVPGGTLRPKESAKGHRSDHH